MKPNRKIMPSCWIITDPERQIEMQLDQKSPGKLVNPINKVVFAWLDSDEKEVFRLRDPRTSTPDRIFGPGPGERAILADDKLVAKLANLPRQEPQPAAKGFFGKLRKLLGAR